jgi:hypothetical protein
VADRVDRSHARQGVDELGVVLAAPRRREIELAEERVVGVEQSHLQGCSTRR